jgi:hypothetical protein
MKIFYTGSDIEELAASGVTRLEIGPAVQMTDVARELASELGIELVRAADEVEKAQLSPSQNGGAVLNHIAAPAPSPSLSRATAAPLPAKPRGCQHGPLAVGGPPPAAASTPNPSGQNGVVNRLVNIMTQLTDRRA